MDIMKNAAVKNLFRTLYRDPTVEHPELEGRVDQHIVGMTKLSAVVAFVFWPMIVVMGIIARIPAVKSVIVSFAFVAFLSSIATFGKQHLRGTNRLACFWYLTFPWVMAYYVRMSAIRLKEAAAPFMVMQGAVEYFYFNRHDFSFVVGLFDRLVSINLFYAHIIIFVTLIPTKFKYIPALIGLYIIYGVYAFAESDSVYWLIAYLFVLVLAFFAKAAIEVFVVEMSRKQLDQEEAFRAMTMAVLDRDLELARDIQLSIPVPNKIVSDLYEIEFYLKAHHLVGGDWLAVRREGENKFLILIVDAAGKGLQAALIIHAVQSLWTSAVASFDPEAWISLVNNTLCEMGAKSPHCVTLGLLKIDDSMLTYWSAGHCPILMVGEKNGESLYQEITATGNMMGISKEIVVTPRTVDLKTLSISQIVLCSDGLLSVLPRGRKRRGELNKLAADFHGTLNGLTADDDMTVVNINLLNTRKSTKAA